MIVRKAVERADVRGKGGLRASNSKARMKAKVAVCITGRLDYLPVSADNIHAYVLEALGSGVEVDVFIYSYPARTDQASRQDGPDSGQDWQTGVLRYISLESWSWCATSSCWRSQI